MTFGFKPFISLDNLFFQGASCVLVPGGFGDRGVKGMILAANYARENKVPYLGICLGMQISVIEFARTVSIFLTNFFPIKFQSVLSHPSYVCFVIGFGLGKGKQ